MDFGHQIDDDGLLTAFRNPITRAAVLKFLEGRIGDADITRALVEAADRYELDPALVVALSWQESKFNTRASGVNRNSSIDRGLMQLNSSTFPFLDTEDFYNPYLNADYGAAYLRETMNLSGNIVAALAMYNAGPYRVGTIGAPRMTLDYISNVMNYRNDILQGFREEVASGGVLMSRDIKPVKNPDLL